MPTELPVDQRFDVVPCDPTQALAISEAREGRNYIAQGPPGTGKSQTITNLLADYVAHGQCVLFVFEKRAAIDVVSARLKAIGLGPLCCLTHDAQRTKLLQAFGWQITLVLAKDWYLDAELEIPLPSRCHAGRYPPAG